ELRDAGAVFGKLVSLGVLLTWVVTAVAAHFLLEFDWPLAALLGAILVVTGPTVIGPLLRHLRLRGRVGAILKWEGIVIGPVGAMLAFLVYTVVRAGRTHGVVPEVIGDVMRALVVGTALGLAGAALLVWGFRRYWIPDALHNAVSLAVLLGVYTLADLAQEE